MTKCSCNIARLLVSFTKEFELDDVGRALDYWSLLKGLKTPSGSDVFEMAVSRAVYLTGQADAILGVLGTDGKRCPALIDEYLDDPSDTICRVAHDTELGGDCTQAVKLYMLANTPLKAIELLCSELSDSIRVNRSRMGELRCLAEDVISGNDDFAYYLEKNNIQLMRHFFNGQMRCINLFFLIKKLEQHQVSGANILGDTGLKTPSGSDVFEMAVSRAVYLTGQADAILGVLGTDGKRCPALIDEYLDDPSDTICRVAHDTELGGDCTQAVKLYMLANTPLKAVELLCSELSDSIRVNRSRMGELRCLAEDVISAQSELRASVLSTMCILLDIGILIDLCETDQPDKALSVSQQLRLIPVDLDQVPVIVGEFHLVPQKVREVIPDLCLHLMRCMVNAIHSTVDPTVKYVKQVKAIVVYAATVNYKFPQHITSRLLQLQATVAV
ncbi:hypothetical protein NECAME_09712 [Necator americanus]|uniref:Nuclear pore protein n=1 Tax=Necator americanus TaxID=51031 RepID=W2TEJ9_NECAM|nr:hypothetical protein NECAME_09712 [Necator americanus]ETN79626.1 hypothetical protein NECAME_09712 [Necator americanus]